MNKLYDEYVAKYLDVIKADYVKIINQPKKYVIKQDVWITIRFFNDNGVEPFDQEKLKKMLNDLMEQQEYKLINAIADTGELIQAYLTLKRNEEDIK